VWIAQPSRPTTRRGKSELRPTADLANRHEVKPGIFPERLWRRLYIRVSHRRRAADQAAASAFNAMSPADWLKRR
jgi:hypothetical protein